MCIVGGRMLETHQGDHIAELLVDETYNTSHLSSRETRSPGSEMKPELFFEP